MRVFRLVPPLAALAPSAALAAAALLVVLAPAARAATEIAVTGAATPSLTGFPTTPQNITLTMEGRLRGDEIDGRFPDTSTRIVFWFTHGARVNNQLFPSCDVKKLVRARGSPRACPRGSRIGRGFAIGTAISVTARLTMDVYNGPGGKTMIFYFTCNNPILIRQVIVAPFEKLHGNPRYGFKITLPVPPGLQELSPGMITSLSQFKTTVGGQTVEVREHGRTVKRGFIEAMTCPPGALVVVRGQFTFRRIPSQTVDSYLGCGKAPPFPPGFTPPVLGSS